MPPGEVNLYGDEFNSLFRQYGHGLSSIDGIYGSVLLHCLLCLCFLLVGIAVGFFTAFLIPGVRYNHNNNVNKTTKVKRDIETTTKLTIPRHIAVIMDGNRRFGRMTMQSDNPFQGHMSGGQTLVDFCDWCMQEGVEIVTVYAFSSENWTRDPVEVQYLMEVFAKYAVTFKQEALTRNVKVHILSTDTDKLPAKVLQSMDELERSTASCTGFTVNICLSYGSRGDITRSCRRVAELVQSGEVLLADVNEDLVNRHLSTKGAPDPDLLIRTSGEYRLSNFLLWQMAYTEFFFIDKFWPQITQNDLKEVLEQYSKRNRRYGN